MDEKLNKLIDIMAQQNIKIIQKNYELNKENYDLKQALNRIAMLGSSEVAYTSEFTEQVNNIARAALAQINNLSET